MKTTRTYQSICTTCNGNGQLMDNPNATNPYRVCPVCNGAKTITVTETIESESPVAQLMGREELKDAILFGYNLRANRSMAQLDVISYNLEVFIDEYLSTHPLQEKPSDELRIMEEIKFGFDICSDNSSFCLGYRNLVKKIESLKDGLIPVKEG
jgi:hypothetical protein